MTLVESIMNIIGRISGDLLANVLAGIVGSLLTWLFVVVSTRLAQRRKFADYAGRYETYTVEGSRISDEFINVKWMGDSLLFARSESQGDIWESYITLNNAVPHVGSGFFQYKTRVDFGVHQIQQTLDKQTIFVFAENPSLPKATIAYVWKKMPDIQQHARQSVESQATQTS